MPTDPTTKDLLPENRIPFALWWLKRDFRLFDNPAFTAAIKSGLPVLPVFILEPSILDAPETSVFHIESILEAVQSLNSRLQKIARLKSSPIALLRCEAIAALEQIHRTVEIVELHAHEEIGTLRTFNRDKSVTKWCRRHDIKFVEHIQTGVFRRLENRNHRMRHWHGFMNQSPLQEPTADEITQALSHHATQQIPTFDAKDLRAQTQFKSPTRYDASKRQNVTEIHAFDTLHSFLHQRGLNYSSDISSPNTAFESGSRLSAHLAWGTITARTVWHELNCHIDQLKNSDDPSAPQWRRSLSSFRSRLNWRDHFIQRLETEPDMELHSLNRAYEHLPSTEDPNRLIAWLAGETGWPLVDACLRCLQTTGFLNFRMRSMITSAATHALRINWKEINWPLASWWTDYEPGIHLSQLQMQSGVVGINTLRTYNPAKQIADHDPNCKFIRHWLPELSNTNIDAIISHQDKPTKHYIQPIVDWKTSSSKMRADYYALKKQPETKRLAEIVFEKHGSRKRTTTARKTKKKNSSFKKKRTDPNSNVQLRLDF